MPECIVFKPEELLPVAWRGFLAAGPVRMFNPALLRDGGNWIFAFRVVAMDGLRRLAVCRLDGALRPVVGSSVALTDLIQIPRERGYPEQALLWFADPRLYRLGGRLFIYWNSGWHEPHNCQFLHELRAADFRPVGVPREMKLAGARQPLEKNWTLFGTDPFYAIYSPTPHRVLSFSLSGDGDIEFAECASVPWADDGLRGGAPPQLVDGRYWSFCHMIENAPDGYRYTAAVYRFAAAPPFAPTDAPTGTLALGNPFGGRRLHAKLNPAVGEVIYPCGAAHEDGRWLVSHGINDEHCAISILSEADVARALRPVRGAG
jgi:hypothetical protein